jgi:prevent-host-death family protein
MATWQLQTAKAKLSELLRAVRDEGPQVISVRGKEEYVVTRRESVPASELFDKKVPRTWDELFDPVRGLGDELEAALQGVREDRASYDGEKS